MRTDGIHSLGYDVSHFKITLNGQLNDFLIGSTADFTAAITIFTFTDLHTKSF